MANECEDGRVGPVVFLVTLVFACVVLISMKVNKQEERIAALEKLSRGTSPGGEK